MNYKWARNLAIGLTALALSLSASAQLIYGNTFPFWNVNGPLTVTGLTTLSGGTTLTGTTSLTSPAITTSITTPSTSFAAFNTTATTLNIGGAATTVTLGAATGTVTVGPAIVGSIATDSTTSTTGAWKTAGGLGVAKALNVGTTGTFTGLLYANGGIVGSVTNDLATVGNYGEYKTTTIASGGAVAGAATTAFANVVSVSLTAGDWDVQGTCDLIWAGVTATVVNCGLGTTTDTMASQAGGSGIATDPAAIEIATFGTTLTGTKVLHTPVTRVSLAGTTTIYLVSGMTYSAGTFTQYGTIRARRMR